MAQQAVFRGSQWLFAGLKWGGRLLTVAIILALGLPTVVVGLGFLMNRETVVYQTPGYYMIKFPISPLYQATLSRFPATREGIRITNTATWRDSLVAEVHQTDTDLSLLTYTTCEWRWMWLELRSITTCVVRHASPPVELREAILRGRQLLATVP